MKEIIGYISNLYEELSADRKIQLCQKTIELLKSQKVQRYDKLIKLLKNNQPPEAIQLWLSWIAKENNPL